MHIPSVRGDKSPSEDGYANTLTRSLSRRLDVFIGFMPLSISSMNYSIMGNLSRMQHVQIVLCEVFKWTYKNMPSRGQTTSKLLIGE